MKEKPNKLITRLNLYEKIIVAIIGILFAVYCISLVMPIVWATLMSFKDVIEYTLDPYGLPQKLSFENYVSVWNKMKISVLTSRGVVEYWNFRYGRKYVAAKRPACPWLSVFSQPLWLMFWEDINS